VKARDRADPISQSANQSSKSSESATEILAVVGITSKKSKPARVERPQNKRTVAKPRHEAKASTDPHLRLIGRREVLSRVPISYTKIWELMQTGRFPRSRRVSPGKVGWLEHEIDAWIASRPPIKLKGDKQLHQSAPSCPGTTENPNCC
jgi:prophage regulatory protein